MNWNIDLRVQLADDFWSVFQSNGSRRALLFASEHALFRKTAIHPFREGVLFRDLRQGATVGARQAARAIVLSHTFKNALGSADLQRRLVNDKGEFRRSVERMRGAGRLHEIPHIGR